MFDVSEANGGQLFDSLSDALGANGANVPSEYRVGGMSVKFILQLYTVAKTTSQTEPTGTLLTTDPAIAAGTKYKASDLSAFAPLPTTDAVVYYASDDAETPTYTIYTINKNAVNACEYVQYRYMSTNAATNSIFVNVANWQGVDAELTAIGNNLVKTKSVASEFISQSIKGFDGIVENEVDITNFTTGGYYDQNGAFVESQSLKYQKVVIDHTKLYGIKNPGGAYSISSLVLFDENDNVVWFNGSDALLNKFYDLPNFAYAFATCGANSQIISIKSYDKGNASESIEEVDVKIPALEGRISSQSAIESDKISIKVVSQTDITSPINGKYYNENGILLPLAELSYCQSVTIDHTKAYKLERFGRIYDHPTLMFVDSNDDVIYRSENNENFNRIFVFPSYIKKFLVNWFDNVLNCHIYECEYETVSYPLREFNTEFFDRTKNLFAPEHSLLGILSIDGGFFPGYTSYTTFFRIPVLPEKTYVLSKKGNNSIITLNRVIALDANGDFISDSCQINISSYTTPENACYISVSLINSVVEGASFQLEEGTQPTSYISPFRLKGEYYKPIEILVDSVGTNEIQDNAVTEAKTIFFESKNIWDNSVGTEEDVAVTVNINVWKHYLYDNALIYNINYFVTNYLPIGSEQEFFAGQFSQNFTPTDTNIRWICYYDENKNYLSTYTVPTSSPVPRTFTSVEGAAFMRITGYMWNAELGIPHPLKISYDVNDTAYTPYQMQLKDKYISEKQEDIVLPELVLPSETYALSDTENSVYFKNVFEYLKADDIVNATGWNSFERYARKESGIGNLIIKLYDVETLTERKSGSVTVHYGLSTTNNGSKAINTIGDSFTYNGTWFDQINTLCPNLSFVGMRKSYNTDASLRAEGRGGWTLSSYFNTLHSDLHEFTPFMHPTGYKYYGVVEFWKDIVNDTIGEQSYRLNGYNDYKTMFETDGYKLNPSMNDLMYDATASAYKYYDGSAWVTASVTDDDFVFDYAKYIEVWNISSPDFVLIMLGVNDWFGSYSDENAVIWNERMNTFIQSIQAYATSQSKTIIIGICTNTTVASSLNSNYYKHPAFSSRSMFKGRKNTIETFDTAEQKSASVYVVDTGACLDPDYGFNEQQVKPFTYYEGTIRELYDNNGVHPSDAGYKQLGTCAAGFIQYIRGL